MGEFPVTATSDAHWASIAADAEEFAREAGEILMGHFGQLRPDRIRSKSARRDLVTEADVASERLLVQRLRAKYPDHAIEAEEEVQDGGAEQGGLRWFLDPLDGTTNFVHQLPAFAVSMGLFEDDQPVVAVVHAPRLGETFVAHAGGGARLNGVPIRVSETTEMIDAILATGFPYRRGELPNNNLANFNEMFLSVRGLRRMGSAAIDLAYCAAGRLDAYWELHLSPHDVAAGALLVREAGGQVTDLDGGQNWLRGGHIAAGPRELHAELCERLEH